MPAEFCMDADSSRDKDLLQRALSAFRSYKLYYEHHSLTRIEVAHEFGDYLEKLHLWIMTEIRKLAGVRFEAILLSKLLVLYGSSLDAKIDKYQLYLSYATEVRKMNIKLGEFDAESTVLVQASFDLEIFNQVYMRLQESGASNSKADIELLAAHMNSLLPLYIRCALENLKGIRPGVIAFLSEGETIFELCRLK